MKQTSWKQTVRQGWKVVTYHLRLRSIRLRRWWLRNDRRYGFKWRALNLVLAVLILSGAALPLAQQWYQSSRYALSAEAVSLVGHTNQALVKQLSYDSTKQLYQFNKDAIRDSSSLPPAVQKASVGTPATKDTATYALDVPAEFAKGVTYHDVNSSLSFSLVPQFSAMQGQKIDGHLVFPLGADSQAVYTLKNNGLKEDIVVPYPGADKLTFNYTLKLPDTLEAKVIPDSGGAIGIYSANPALFGNINYSSSSDRKAVEKAQVAGEKTYLVFGLPAPTIKTPSGQSLGAANARFVLSGHNLQVVADNLSGLHGPISIDPSVVVTSTSDFQTSGNNEGNIDFSTSGQINRANIAGGSVASSGWNNASSLVAGTSRPATVAYNGYLYALGGKDSSNNALSTVQFAPINSNGTVGTWHYTANSTDYGTSLTNSLSSARYGAAAVAYNGYLYIAGGTSTGTTPFGTVEYAPLNSDGTVGAWSTANTLGTAVASPGAAVYNNTLYILGGTTDGTNPTTAVQYAALNADGSTGTWGTTTGLGTGVYGAAAAAYNGNIYIMGGHDASTSYNTVQYIVINSDGTLGTAWQTANSFTTARYFAAGFAYNGYLYIMGGDSFESDVQYAAINANGSIGNWQTTANMSTGRASLGGAAYNGYLYIVGGDNGTSALATAQYAKIDPAGTVPAFASGTAFTTTRFGAQEVAYNGKLYVLGGDNGGTPVNTIYAANIDTTTGALGTFSSSGMTPFTVANGGPGALTMFSAVAYNGFMYLFGGCASAYSSCTTTTNERNTVHVAPIGATSGSIGTWTSGTAFSSARYGAQAVAYNGTMYIMGGIGGADGTTYLNDIQYQTIGSGGTLNAASWTLSSQSLPTARAYFGASVYGGKLYIAGGCTAGVPTCTAAANDTQYATFSVSGGVAGDLSGAFAAGPNFTNGRGMLGMAIINGYIYLAGGYDGASYYSDVQYAPINSDGSVGSWKTSNGAALSSARAGFGMLAYGGALYVAGGWNGTTYYSDTQYSQPSSGGGGSAGAWNTSANTFSASGFTGGWGYGQMFAANGYIYAVAGYDGTTHGQTYSAPVLSNGTGLGAWTQQTSLVTQRYQFALTVSDGYAYVFAGENGSTLLNTYEYAKILTGGGLGTWTQASITVSGGNIGTRILPSAANYNGYVYLTGGQNGTTFYADVYGASVNTSTGALTWMSSPQSSFTGVRSGHRSFAYDGYVYVVGGCGAGTPCSAYLNDVQYAPLNNSNGTVGSWQYTSALMQARAYGTLDASNGFVYILAGTNSVGSLTDVEQAAINPDGSLGNWERSSGSFVTGTPARTYPGAVIYNGVLYMAGGFRSSNNSYLADIQYAPLNNTARVAHYSKLLNFGVAVGVNSIPYSGTLPATTLVPNAIMVEAAGSAVMSFGAMTDSSMLGASGAATCAQPGTSNTRYLWVTITLDDSEGAVQNDANSVPATVNDFTSNYTPVHAAPAIRLRAGQTLQNGNITGLDTCGT